MEFLPSTGIALRIVADPDHSSPHKESGIMGIFCSPIRIRLQYFTKSYLIFF
jgi:hypothetical protein